ncbi:MAG: two-component system sensor histidine kinase NtrB [Acidobacteriota bacterium]
MESRPTINDLIGIEYAKLGFFRELQDKIAELQTSNLKLARKQRHLQSILDGISDAMVILSPDLRIESVNHVFYEVFKERYPTGKFCYEVFRDKKEPCPLCPVITARDRNQVCRQLAIFPVEGRNRHFEITASPIPDSVGKPSHILLLKRDVTMEKEYQAKFYQAEKMATIGVLAAGVAHEINNPLTAISGFAEGLKRRLPRLADKVDDDLAADFDEYVGIILKECERCREIVQGLLTFGRQNSADFTFVDLNGVVRETLRLLHNDLKKYDKELICLELDESAPPVYGNSSQLKQVVLNLLSNALYATQGIGSITFRTQQKEGWVSLIVEDTGSGIPSECLGKLFEPFFTTKPPGKGIGIGLSTCYNIVKNHGGEIVVCSEEGEGATFFVRLPRDKRLLGIEVL